MAVISMKQFLEAGVHFGHQTKILEKNRSNNIEKYKTNPSDIIKKIKIVHI